MNFKTLSLLLPIIGTSYVNVAYAMVNEEDLRTGLAQNVAALDEQADRLNQSSIRFGEEVERQKQAIVQYNESLTGLTELVTSFEEQVKNPITRNEMRKRLKLDESKRAKLRNVLNTVQ